MEDSYVIKGGNRLEGEITLSGAKNAALKMIIAALLFDEEVILKNIPHIKDVEELLHLITLLGGKAVFIDKNIVSINGSTITENKVDLLRGSRIRVSFMLFAPLLHKFGHCFVPNPGGCRIGARPIDRIIEGMKSLGIEIQYDSDTGYYEAHMKKMPSGKYRFTKPSHTGTELLIMLSLFGDREVIIENSAEEPEIDNLIEFLNQSGAVIKRDHDRVKIQQVKTLRFIQPFSIISDRNEAITYITAALSTNGTIIIKHIHHSLIEAFLKKLSEAGVTIQNGKNEITFVSPQSGLRATDVETSPHPGFMTDWQPNWAILMTQARGTSILHERVFENRFSYVVELRKLGAQIDFTKISIKNPKEYFFFNFDPHTVYQQGIKIHGPQKFHGGVLNVGDLRAGATLAIAALLAEGESVVNGASILERGYENFVEKISSIGGQIKKIQL